MTRILIKERNKLTGKTQTIFSHGTERLNPAIAMTIAPDTLYVFEKSGNEVKTIEPAGNYMGQELWTVERTRGASAGKRIDEPGQFVVLRHRVLVCPPTSGVSDPAVQRALRAWLA